ncbi:MAG: hypothetical protein ACI4TU_09080 [Candidatus Cryptobacteroides sp.]
MTTMNFEKSRFSNNSLVIIRILLVASGLRKQLKQEDLTSDSPGPVVFRIQVIESNEKA